MRDDMAKVIVERPRVKDHMRKGRRVRDLDLLPGRKGLRRAAEEAGSWRMLNENLQPLRRYLHAQIGRPWDKVWSEICANLRPTSTVQQHVRDHVFDFVAVAKVVCRDGVIYHRNDWGSLIPLTESHVPLWVDPRTGILRTNRHYKNRRKRREENRREQAAALRRRMVDAGDGRQYHLLDDGAWWEVTLAPVPTEGRRRHFHGRVIGTARVEVRVEDVVLRAGLSTLPREVLYGRPGVYAVAKRQLSRNRSRRLGLR